MCAKALRWNERDDSWDWQHVSCVSAKSLSQRDLLSNPEVSTNKNMTTGNPLDLTVPELFNL